MHGEIDPNLELFVSKVADTLRGRIQKDLNLQKIIKMMMADSSQSATFGRNDDFEQASGGWKSADGRLSCGFSSCKGRRATMEDFFDVKSVEVGGQAVYLFGIFDGHGGSLAAQYLKKNLFENLISHPKFMTNTKLAISETYTDTDEGFLTDKTALQRDDGSTASTAVLVGNNLYLANVGDSRAIISKAGQAIQLTDDHKPNRYDERKRIENAGGIVMWAGTWRVGGVLAMSRAFGNRLLKQFVVAEPEIQEQEVDEQLEYLVLASDGLWDVVKNEEAVTLVTSQNEPEVAAQKLIETALTRGSADNITCIVVRFHHNDETTTGPTSSSTSPLNVPSSQTSAEGPPHLLATSVDVPSLRTQTTQTDSFPSAQPTSVDSSSADAVFSLAATPVDVPLLSTSGVSDSFSTNNADVSPPATVLDPPSSISVDSPPAPTEDFVPE